MNVEHFIEYGVHPFLNLQRFRYYWFPIYITTKTIEGPSAPGFQQVLSMIFCQQVLNALSALNASTLNLWGQMGGQTLILNLMNLLLLCIRNINVEGRSSGRSRSLSFKTEIIFPTNMKKKKKNQPPQKPHKKSKNLVVLCIRYMPQTS